MTLLILVALLIETNICIALPSTNDFSFQVNFKDSLLNLTIIHSNDVHSHYDQFNKQGLFCEKDKHNTNNCYGGSSKFKTIIDSIRYSKQNVLLLDAGDEFQGTQFYSYFKWEPAAEITNYLGYNLSTIGNHEFDDGPNNLLNYFERLNFPIVCANIVVRNNDRLKSLIKPYHIFEEYDLAIIGYITTDAKTISSPGPDVDFLDAVDTVQYYIDELNKRGIYRIIGLSHYGYLEDINLAKKTKGIQMIVGGHSHSFLSSDPNDKYKAEGPYPTLAYNLNNETVYIVQANEWGKYIGHVDLIYDKDKITQFKGKPIKVDYLIKEDEQMQDKIIRKYKDKFDNIGNEIIGLANTDFDMEMCRIDQCEMGSMTTDALVYFINEINPSIDINHSLDSMVSIVNGGGIRAGLEAGFVKRKMLEIIFPFNNLITVIKVKGHILKKIMEGILSNQNMFNNQPISRTAQFGNMRIEFDSKAKKFNKLKKMLVKSSAFCQHKQNIENIDSSTENDYCVWEELEINKNYTLVTLDYLATGGDSILPVLQDETTLLNFTLLNAVEFYINKTSPISRVNDKRLKDISIDK